MERVVHIDERAHYQVFAMGGPQKDYVGPIDDVTCADGSVEYWVHHRYELRLRLYMWKS